MKFTFAATAVAAASLKVQYVDELKSTTLGLSEKFQVYKTRFNKNYDDNEKDAFNAFSDNEKIIQEHNAKGLSWTLGHNEYSDLTWETFKARYVGGFQYNPHLNRTKNYDYSLLTQNVTASSIDWRSKGAVTPVKNQEQCGSCWAFSTVGAVEGGYQIAGNNLTKFSEQDLVSCDNAQHGGTDEGCNGGLMDNAFKWIETNGLCSESDYPYTSGGGDTGTCKSTCKAGVTVSGFSDVPGESGMIPAINKGPVSVAIEADRSTFQLYRGGVIDNEACGKQLDHGVLVVAYGTDSSLSKDYYTIKNSWGGSWGEQGYVRFVRDKDQCGVADSASYPTGVKPMGPGPGPSPPSPSPPAPGPSPSSGAHYGDPKQGGCLSDEIGVQIGGVPGDFCSPACTGIMQHTCPSDVPSGVTASPQCLLQDAQGNHRCVLECSPSGTNQCGSGSCKAIQGIGLCTYDD